MRRRGFEAGFKGVRVLVPQGVDTRRCRLGATYCEAPFTFEHILQAISVPNGEVDRAKLLAAFLNSRLAVWYAFHGTGSFDSYRPKVHQEHLLRLPLPTPSDLPDKEAAAEAAARELIDVIDNARGRAADPFSLESDVPDVLRRIDHLVYRCFGLNDDEVAVIEDTVEFIIPALQPHDGSVPELWRAPDACECAAYAAALAENLRPWFRGSDPISRRLLARSADLGIAELCVAGSGLDVEHRAGQVTALLERLSAHIDQPLDGNLQLKPDLRVSLGEYLYVIKPMQLRFWLESTALADADAIALDLQQAVEMQRRQSTG